MKLTRSVSYAVGILLTIEKAQAKGPLTAARISRGAKFPPRFLYRVLRKLVDANLLIGVSGPGGGYSLARKPREISLLDIVEAVEGDDQPSLLEPAGARYRQAIKHINQFIRRDDERFRKELSRIKLDRLAKL